MDNNNERKTKKIWGNGGGLYRDLKVSVKLLNIAIGIGIITLIIIVIYLSANGGYWVTFDSNGGSNVKSEKYKHGQLVLQPTNPQKVGYTLESWYFDQELANEWDFETDLVGNPFTLYAKWMPNNIVVKFDTSSADNPSSITILFGETYGSLPLAEKSGAVFCGWIYEGKKIFSDTLVATSGEHVLTAMFE